MLVIKTCDYAMETRNGFKWPSYGLVECPDWSPEPTCGHGLHGLGPGDNNPGQWYSNGHYLAIEAENIINIGGKVKFQKGFVLYCTKSRESLSIWLREHNYPGPWYNDLISNLAETSISIGDYSLVSCGTDMEVIASEYCKIYCGSCSKITTGNNCTIKANDSSIEAKDLCEITGTHLNVVCGSLCTLNLSSHSEASIGTYNTVYAEQYTQIHSKGNCTVISCPNGNPKKIRHLANPCTIWISLEGNIHVLA